MKPKEKVLFISTAVGVIAIQAQKYKDNSLVTIISANTITAVPQAAWCQE